MQCSIENLRLSYENLSSLIHHHRLELTYRDESDESAELREMDLETDHRTILRPSGFAADISSSTIATATHRRRNLFS